MSSNICRFELVSCSGILFLMSITLISVSRASSERFTVNDSGGTVLDSETGLEWLPGPAEETQWFQVDHWLEELEPVWRVPLDAVS